MTPGLSFRLFGTVEITDAAGRRLDLGTRKQRALIAMLAVQPGRVMSLDRLIDELWGGEPPAQATRTLQAYVAHLRRVLEPDRPPRTPPAVLLTREPGYLIAVAPGQVDLERFAALADDGRRAMVRAEHLEAVQVLDQALQLWRGEPLGEFADEAFARPIVSRLSEVRTGAVEDSFEARLALGEAAACVPGLEAQVDEQPYRERAWALLVLALYRAGRQADALAALRGVRARLAADLGLSPGPELQQLEQSVFEQAPELQLPAASRPATVSINRPVADPDALIGRETELALAEDRLAAVRRGRGGVFLVTGEAGIGKTRYAAEVADRAASRGFRITQGRCVDGTAPAFWPWIQVLREAGADTGLLTGGQRAVGGHPPTDGDPNAALYQLYERVAGALTSDEPLLVLLDDLQWADVSSLRLLSYLADEVTRRPVLILATLRPEPGDNPRQLRDTLGVLARQLGTERIDLSPFTAPNVVSYLRARGIEDEESLITELLARTGGNPFYLRELLRLRDSERGRRDAVPAGARDVIERRVARLPEETAQLLRIAAVAGGEGGIDLLADITDHSIEDVMSSLEPAVATGLLTEPPSGPDYRFSHALVRDALYSGLSRLDRARLHLRVGEALEPVMPAAESATLARHFAAAVRVGGATKAVAYAVGAARHATVQLAYDEAVEFRELALSALPPGNDAARSRLLTELGQARRAVGDAASAGRDLDEAFDLARETDDREATLAILMAYASPTLWNWRPYGLVRQPVVAAIEELLADPLNDHDRASLLGALGVELHYGPRRADGERLAAEAVKLARKHGDNVLRARTLGNYLLASFAPGRTSDRLRAAREMADLPGQPRSTELIARIFTMSCLLRLGDLSAWEVELDHCRQLLDRAPSPELESMVRVAQTARATLDGRWEEAAALVGEHANTRFAATPWGARFRTLVTTYTCKRGQDRVPEILNQLVKAAHEPNLVPLRPVAVLAAVESDRQDLARKLIDRWGTEIGDDWTSDFLLPVWSLVAARLGNPDPRLLYDRLSPFADQLIVAGMGSASWGSTHLVLAELADRLGHPDLSRTHAQAALDTHRKLGLSYWTAQSQHRLEALAR